PNRVPKKHISLNPDDGDIFESDKKIGGRIGARRDAVRDADQQEYAQRQSTEPDAQGAQTAPVEDIRNWQLIDLRFGFAGGVLDHFPRIALLLRELKISKFDGSD